MRVSTAAGEWRTGEDGTVVAGPASPGVFTASADHPDYVGTRRGTRIEPPADDAEAPPVVLRLSPAIRLSGRAVLEDVSPTGL